MFYMMRLAGSEEDTREYKHAGKKAKSGLSMVMDGVEQGDMDMVVEGVEKAWKGVETMCDISKTMEEQYAERRHDEMDERGGRYGTRGGRGGYYDNRYDRREEDWNERDDEMMRRRMRDSMGRYTRR